MDYEQRIKELEGQIKQLQEENKLKDIKIENMNLTLNKYRKMIFGPGRERTPENFSVYESDQLSLFCDEEEKLTLEEIQEAVKEITVKPHKRKINKAGIREDKLKDFDFEIEEYDIDAEEKCDICKSNLVKVGRKLVRQRVEYIPAKLAVVSVYQNTYKCTSCGDKDSENINDHFVKAAIPRPLLNHSFVSASLASQIIYQKYFMGMPLNRQEKFWYDLGLALPRGTMASWCNKFTEYYLKPVRDLMHKEILAENELVLVDETRMQCNKEKGRTPSTNSFMWVLHSGENEEKRGVIFKYSPSRSSEVAKSMLENYKGIFVTDGYSGYNAVPEALHAECWAHLRRKLLDSIPLGENKKPINGTAAEEGLKYVRRLFEIEEELSNMPDDERLENRNKFSRPIYEEILSWHEKTSQKIITNEKLKEALTYIKNQHVELGQFLNDGRIPLTTNLVERSIRPFAVHRRAWLFADTPAGAVCNAVMYSLVESAGINNLNIFKYIEYLLTVLPQLDNLNDEEQLKQYLPWSESLPASVRSSVSEVLTVNKELLVNK
ncbi:MAG: IS66 family transposase [Sedimentibacter sp.]